MTEGERKNMKQDTLEGRAKTKNGVKRLCFSAVCILLEAAFIIAMITKLNQYAEIINLMTRLLAGVLVLKLYASDQTSSMKMPWVILILVFPIMGVGLYLLIGLNGGTLKMRERYAQIDRELLPLLPNDSECRETLGRKIPKAGNISDYIQKMPPIRSIRIQMLFIMMRQSKGWRLSWQIWQRQRNSFLWNIMPLRMHRPGIKSRVFWRTA